MSDNGWKATTWTAASEHLKGSEASDGGVVKTAEACLARWSSVCSIFPLSSVMLSLHSSRRSMWQFIHFEVCQGSVGMMRRRSSQQRRLFGLLILRCLR